MTTHTGKAGDKALQVSAISRYKLKSPKYQTGFLGYLYQTFIITREVAFLL